MSVIFTEPLHVGRPSVGDRGRFLQRVDEILDRGWFTNNGPVVCEFEKAVASYLGVRNCVATCNATVALELVYRAMGFKGEVIVPSFTFVATVHALHWQGFTPVFCDIDPDTHNIDPVLVERLVTEKTRGIVGVHLWGRPCDIGALQDIADRYDLELVFDAAHALGCSWSGKKIGNFGRCEVFSFHATKFMNSFEGGAITTNDDELAERLRLTRNFGFDGYDNVIHPGINGKMTEICAAMGLTNLECIDELISVNQRNYVAYQEGLEEVQGLSLVEYEESQDPNYQYVVLEVDAEEYGRTRDDLVSLLHAENVLARRYFYPGVHRLEPYRTDFPDAGKSLRESEALACRVLVLPTGASISQGEVESVCGLLRKWAPHFSGR